MSAMSSGIRSVAFGLSTSAISLQIPKRCETAPVAASAASFQPENAIT